VVRRCCWSATVQSERSLERARGQVPGMAESRGGRPDTAGAGPPERRLGALRRAMGVRPQDSGARSWPADGAEARSQAGSASETRASVDAV
jgi:hypothetical protein